MEESLKEQFINIKDSQPMKGVKIIFLANNYLVSGMCFKEVRDGKGIALDTHHNKEEKFEYWAYKLEFTADIDKPRHDWKTN